MRFVAGRGAVAELLVRAAGESSWPGCRGGAASTGSRRKQLAGVPWGSCWYGQPAEAAGGVAVAELLVRAASGSSWRERCGGMERSGSLYGKVAAPRATPLRQREGAEHHREEAKWQQSALYSIFIPVPQAPYCHSYHNKIQKGRVILRYRE